MFYEHSIERFWDQLKTEAAKWAAADRPLPTDEEARNIVSKLGIALNLPPGAQEYYAGEFCRMIEEKRERLGEEGS
jgi:hypothetical protein